MKKFVIDGYFVIESMNGIPRYATEIVKRLDACFPKGSIELVIPSNTSTVPALSNIKIVRRKEKYQRNFVWSRIVVGRYALQEKACCINFNNKTNMIKGSVSMIHDLIPLRHDRYPADFLNIPRRKLWYDRWKAELSFCENIFWKKRKDRYIVTVSEYSRQKIIKRFHIPEEKIVVIGNGWEHLGQIEEVDEHKSDRIRPDCYYFFIGNISPHKNIGWILKAAEKMPDEIFVIAGKIRDKFADSYKKAPDNVVWLGHISDGYMKFLMRGAKALLFPSLEEGFGIPPLEALVLGTRVIVSDIPVMREIYGDTVHYVDINESPVNLNKVLEEKLRGDVAEVLEAHSWEKAADQWKELIRKVMEEDRNWRVS